jgi:hypothetical protein
MLYISYRGIYNGTNYEDANTPTQIRKALNSGYSCMVDVWRVDNKLYLGTDLPLVEVTPAYLQGRRFWLNVRNTAMQEWIVTQPSALYPNYFWFTTPTPPPAYVTASNGKLITPGTVPINNNSVIYLPEVSDQSYLSTIQLRCYGVCSTNLSFIKRIRNEGARY